MEPALSWLIIVSKQANIIKFDFDQKFYVKKEISWDWFDQSFFFRINMETIQKHILLLYVKGFEIKRENDLLVSFV